MFPKWTNFDISFSDIWNVSVAFFTNSTTTTDTVPTLGSDTTPINGG